MTDERIRELAERAALKEKCPDCNADVDRPKCMFELGSACPRHELREHRQKQIKAIEQAIQEAVAEEREAFKAEQNAGAAYRVSDRLKREEKEARAK